MKRTINRFFILLSAILVLITAAHARAETVHEWAQWANKMGMISALMVVCEKRALGEAIAEFAGNEIRTQGLSESHYQDVRAQFNAGLREWTAPPGSLSIEECAAIEQAARDMGLTW